MTKTYPLWKSILLAALYSVIANSVITVVLKMIFVVPEGFAPLMLVPIAMFTVAGTLGAAIVFAIMRKYSSKPVAVFTPTAYTILILSLIPDALLLDVKNGITVPVVAILMVLHIVTALIIVNLFTKHTVSAQ